MHLIPHTLKQKRAVAQQRVVIQLRRCEAARKEHLPVTLWVFAPSEGWREHLR